MPMEQGNLHLGRAGLDLNRIGRSILTPTDRCLENLFSRAARFAPYRPHTVSNSEFSSDKLYQSLGLPFLAGARITLAVGVSWRELQISLTWLISAPARAPPGRVGLVIGATGRIRPSATLHRTSIRMSTADVLRIGSFRVKSKGVRSKNWVSTGGCGGNPPEPPQVCPDFLKSGTHPI